MSSTSTHGTKASPGGTKAATTSATTSDPPLTELEKKYLKEYWGNEFKFLRDHGLKIHDDDDRAEGRRILRAFMQDNPDFKDDDDKESSDGNQFLADLESDPTSHVADYHFSEEQLDWIQKNYRHSGNFMLSYGLKPWDDDSCAEAVQILKSLMEE